ncbi:MAG: hypothetical protein NW208_01935 [Bryobacter sp.]|nr:hypothetical protein [Bryobacter sp.]
MTVRLARLTRRAALLVAVGLRAQEQAQEEELRVGGVRFRVVKHGEGSRRYLHIHGNENTAREVLEAHMKQANGTAYFVVSDTRNVTVAKGCAIDPNRMFTSEGARASLRRYNTGLTLEKQEACEAALAQDRAAFVSRITPPGRGLLVAMHNNRAGYSVLSEVKISDAVSLGDEANPHEFMLATNEEDYRRLAAGKFNVVLQKTVRVDDGSFSVVANLRGVRYVNIEAGLGKREKQQEMLEHLERVLD